MMKTVSLPLALVLVCALNVHAGSSPSQVHISLGGTPHEMTVEWVTDPSDGSVKSEVLFGVAPKQLTEQAFGTNHIFTDGGAAKRNITVHKVPLRGLKPDTTYYYVCGDSDQGYSTLFSFTTQSVHAQAVRLALYGDLGFTNSQSLVNLQKRGMTGDIDGIVHVGDFAYNLESDDGIVGDKFMDQIEPLAANYPYMVCPGNHEQAYNFTHYTNRFDGQPYEASNSPSNWYFSYDLGYAHFVAFSSEIYFTNTQLRQQQYEWLELDLAKANKNRKERPWIILYSHRPMYCSCDGDCDQDAETLRDGDYGIEELAYKYGVDMYFCGHEHNYERLYPVYKGEPEYPCEMPCDTYDNPSLPVQIVTGSAGCSEGQEPFVRQIGKFSAFHSATYGYGLLDIYNQTHLQWRQMLDTNDEVLDELWVVQTNHGPRSEETFFSDVSGRYDAEKRPSVKFYAYGMTDVADLAEQPVESPCPEIKRCVSVRDGADECYCMTHDINQNTCVWHDCSRMW